MKLGYFLGCSLALAFALTAFAQAPAPGAGQGGQRPGGQPGQGDAKDEMLVDDVQMVYNSELTSAVYDGQAVQFDEDGIAALPATKPFDPALLQLTSNGHGSSIKTAFLETDCGENSGELFITVCGDDQAVNPANLHIYCIRFCNETVRVRELAAQQHRSTNATYDLTGRRVEQPGNRVSTSAMERKW